MCWLSLRTFGHREKSCYPRLGPSSAPQPQLITHKVVVPAPVLSAALVVVAAAALSNLSWSAALLVRMSGPAPTDCPDLAWLLLDRPLWGLLIPFSDLSPVGYPSA